MSDRESSCRNTRRGPGPGFGYGFSLDPESTSQRAIADERSQAAVSVARMCHSRLLNSDPKPKNISRLRCLLFRVVYCSRRDATCFRTVRQNHAKIMRAAKGSSVPFHLRHRGAGQGIDVGKQLQTKVAPPCKRHAKSNKSEYPKRILGKLDMNRMYDPVHKKSSLKICEIH